jgi:hypothetical protein
VKAGAASRHITFPKFLPNLADSKSLGLNVVLKAKGVADRIAQTEKPLAFAKCSFHNPFSPEIQKE